MSFITDSFHFPLVLEQTPRGLMTLDIVSKLLSDRIILLVGSIDDRISSSIIAQLLYLESENADEDITLYINSPGGDVISGLAIYDVMQYLSCDVVTVGFGQAASMAAILLAAGTKNKRLSLPNTRIMIHQPLAGVLGQVTEIEIRVNELNRLRNRLIEILARHTGKSTSQIKKDTDRDYFLTAEESVEYGIIDKVIAKRVE